MISRWLYGACIVAAGVACNGIRAAPIYDDEDLDAGRDAPDAAADAPPDTGVDAATDADAD